MCARRNQVLQLLVMASLLLTTQSNAQAGEVQAKPPEQIEKIIESHPPVMDSISESATRQRAARRNEMTNKLAASTAVNTQAVPAIQVNAIPSGIGNRLVSSSEKAEQDMLLIEVLRSSVKSVAGISIFGTLRHVVAGDDLGNGWKVTDVDRFKVNLTETQGVGKSVKGAAGRKTRTLLLGTPQRPDSMGTGMQAAANGMRP